MLISGEPRYRTAEPIPYGVAKCIGLNRRGGLTDWRLVRRNGAIFAQPFVDNEQGERQSEKNLSTEYWEPSNRIASVALRFRLAPADNTLIEARELLERSHPHGAPMTGVFIVCSIADPDAQEERLSQRPQDRDDPWSSAWRGGPGAIVGCVVLSRLFHGYPKSLREDIASVDGTELTGSRKQAVNSLGLVWLSRVAVDAPYRSCRIGTALVAEARRVAADTLPWPARYLEVIRTVTEAQANRRHQANYEDFFTRAGYHLAQEDRRASPMRGFNRDGTRMTDIQRCKRFYYWAPVS
jgi:GNAT superfamily N-acetyltransferase